MRFQQTWQTHTFLGVGILYYNRQNIRSDTTHNQSALLNFNGILYETAEANQNLYVLNLKSRLFLNYAKSVIILKLNVQKNSNGYFQVYNLFIQKFTEFLQQFQKVKFKSRILTQKFIIQLGMFEETIVSAQKGKGVLQNQTANQASTTQINFNSIWFEQDSDDYPTNKGQKHFKARPTLSIDTIFIKTGWTKDEEEELFTLHDEIGNKWAILANRIYGRTDNCVKNHFYSKLRKAMRKLNKYIHDFYRKEFKEIHITAIYKIVQGNQEKFKPKSTVDPQTTLFCQKLKNRLLRFYDEDQMEVYEQKSKIRKMISQIIQFNKNYKRQSRRKRKGSGDTEWNKNSSKKQRKNSDDICSSSQQEEQEDINFPIITSPKKRRAPKKQTINPQSQSKQKLSELQGLDKIEIKEANSLPLIPLIRPTASRIQMEQEQGVQSILRSAGMMEDCYQMPMIFLKKDFSILSRFSRPISDNPNDQHDAFFDQSDLHNIGRTNGFNPFEYMREQHNEYE